MWGRQLDRSYLGDLSLAADLGADRSLGLASLGLGLGLGRTWTPTHCWDRRTNASIHSRFSACNQ